MDHLVSEAGVSMDPSKVDTDVYKRQALLVLNLHNNIPHTTTTNHHTSTSQESKLVRLRMGTQNVPKHVLNKENTS